MMENVEYLLIGLHITCISCTISAKHRNKLCSVIMWLICGLVRGPMAKQTQQLGCDHEQRLLLLQNVSFRQVLPQSLLSPKHLSFHHTKAACKDWVNKTDAIVEECTWTALEKEWDLGG